MNKKIVGKPLVFVLIALMVIGVGSAALVGYLSNQTTATMEINSPFDLKNSVGHLEPLSTSSADATGLTSGGEIDFGSLVGTQEIQWTNYIKHIGFEDIPVKDFEAIRGYDSEETPLTMDELNTQFSFFGARYWRPQGNDFRLEDYAGDIELGYDPYTLDTEGTITCHGNTPTGPYGADISTESYIDIKDGICYYVEEAFSYEVVSNDLVSDYAYTYIVGTEELAQYTAVWAAATTPGTYDYMRVINVE